MATITKAENTAAFFVAAIAGKGSAGISPVPPTFPPSERVFYLRTENGEVILSENGNALVTEQSAT